MNNNEFLLHDRITKIRSVINKYGEDNFYISYSGGKDSCVLSFLIDMAFPNNSIPRTYANTGIELNMVKDFVLDQQKKDSRIIILKPSTNIKQMLEREGYPFKSKNHALLVWRYQTKGMIESVKQYLGAGKWGVKHQCPKCLKYQFSDDFQLKVSDKCCFFLKEEPLTKYAKKYGKKYTIDGIMREEGGRREKATCMVFQNKKLKKFQPLAVVTKSWEEWLIDKYNIDICKIYYPPYNFERTGCKGCPNAFYLEDELHTLSQFFPNERKQCELIWKPVYEEYRRIGYRLPKNEQISGQMNINEYLSNVGDRKANDR